MNLQLDQLTAAGAVASGDLFIIQPAGGGTALSVTGQNVSDFITVAVDALISTDAAAESAYAAQASETQTQSLANQTILLLAQAFPPDFLYGSTFWANVNGQLYAPIDGAGNDLYELPGTFVTVEGIGQVYQTEAPGAVTGQGSFTTLGVIAGVPGTTFTVTASVRALTANTTGSATCYVGVGHLTLDAAFTPGDQGYSASATEVNELAAGAGWTTLTYSFTIPQTGAAAWYRPRLFYNYDAATYGNQQYQVAHVAVSVSPPGELTPPQATDVTATGAGTWATPTAPAPLYLRVTMQGGGGGGAGSGSAPGNGGAGGATTFGAFTAGGGSGGSGVVGGAGGSASGGTIDKPGQAGGAGANGFTYTPGGQGGGADGTIAVGSASAAGAPAGSGSGGGGGGAGSQTNAGGAGGGEGGFMVVLIEGTLAATYGYSVGAGGAGGAGQTTGGAGGSGRLTIEAFYQ